MPLAPKRPGTYIFKDGTRRSATLLSRPAGGVMDWVIAIIVGAFIGWLASRIMRTSAQQGFLADVVVGILGAALGRALFGRGMGVEAAESAGAFSLAGILWGVVGAVVLVAILKGLRVFRPA